MKTLCNKFDKKDIAALPRVVFEGRIFVIQTEQEAQKAVSYLLAQPLLGFDTETRPSFRPGPMRAVALLQVATQDTCFLFRLNRIGLPQALVGLLGDRRIPKIALSWKDDTKQLQRLQRFEMGDFVELQSYVREFGIEDASLQKLYANVFGQKISKGQQLSNWENDVLSEAQQRYAATDAWACVRLYEELERLKETKDWELKKYEEPVSE
ncbi:MAG: 3'-5' exonuclease domain-containing protein 2 [Bacteroidaceae bacterium]|nr:3'-5' exonuclease domain-containing protein 2 [Bacteroidaceae bacterium]